MTRDIHHEHTFPVSSFNRKAPGEGVKVCSSFLFLSTHPQSKRQKASTPSRQKAAAADADADADAHEDADADADADVVADADAVT